MKEFVLIFRLRKGLNVKPTPEQIKERMDWLGGIAAQQKLADKGNTLSVTNAKTVMPDNVVTDGPYSESNEFVSGYMLVKTDSMDEAIELAKANPIFKVGGNVEVREVVKLISGK